MKRCRGCNQIRDFFPTNINPLCNSMCNACCSSTLCESCLPLYLSIREVFDVTDREYYFFFLLKERKQNAEKN